MTNAEMENLLSLLNTDLTVGWSEVIEWLRETNQVDDIAQAILTGNYSRAISGITDAARSFASDVQNAFNVSANQARTWLDNQIQTEDVAISYDTANPRAVRWAAENRYDIIRATSNDLQENVRHVITRGVAEGTNPLQIANDVRDGLGLTPAQDDIVHNFRRELREGRYSDALSRRLVNGNMGRSIRAAQDNNRPLTQERIDKLVEDYRQEWIDYRSETIARTQSMRAAHQGTDELYAQAIENGTIRGDQLVQTWYAGPKTADARDGHQMLNGVEIPIGGVWTNPLTGAQLRFPGDPDADVSETANCRCTKTIRYRRPGESAPVGMRPRAGDAASGYVR